ncbi:exocyst complex component Exo84 [Arctopsyche grandis]|uniref:exocyst complex component Exo84 n=1 Tax=Arctopsyche grandis TaxID=121162 RepID=UPI00406DA3C9
MTDAILKRIGTSDFNPDKYVKELARSCVGGEELKRQRQIIQTLNEETADTLKKNVYENYMQFIDTAKEISHLEAEMYQLSHLLTEQRNLLESLATASILGNESTMSHTVDANTVDNEAEKAEEQRKLKLNGIFEKVESCMSLLDVPDRTLIHEGDVHELDPVENTPLQRMHAYLFSDCLMLTSWIPNRRGPVRYRFHSVYSVSSMAVVNVKDLGNVKQAFKLLAFLDTRVFQCGNLSSKKDWLEKFEFAKKTYLAKQEQKEVQKRESSHEKTLSRPESAESSTNPFLDESPIQERIVLPDWLIDVAEELDVLIVERHFEKAFKLMQSAEKELHLDIYSTLPMTTEILSKLSVRQKTLTEVLIKELEVTPEWTPRGGLKAIRNSVCLLIKLKMITQACDLFLAICSKTMEVHVKGVQLEGSTVAYVKQVGEVFFCTMTDVIKEFIRAFPQEKTSALVVWASAELRILMNQMVKQIFTPQATLSSITECVVSLREQCVLLKEFGLDLCFQLDGSLRNCIIKALKDYREKVLDSIKGKVVEDKWTPVNMNTKVGVNAFLEEMQELGLILAKYVINETWIDLSSSTIWFTKSVLTLQYHGLRVVSEDMMEALDDSIYGIFNGRLMLSIGNDSSYAQKNFKFILDTLLPVMLRKYAEETGYENEKLLTLAHKYGICIAKQNTAKKPTSNVTKYSSDYL